MVQSYIEDVVRWQCSRHSTNYHEEHWTMVDPDTPGDTCTTDNSALSHVNKCMHFKHHDTLILTYHVLRGLIQLRMLHFISNTASKTSILDKRVKRYANWL